MKHTFLFHRIFLFCLLAVTGTNTFAANTGKDSDVLKQGFLQVPDSIRTGVFWYWMSDNISREGVVEDLHAMKQAGINLAFIGIIGPSTHHTSNYPYGQVKFLSDEWWDILHTALKTASSLDIEIGIFNSPGWSQSGGPWITPDETMRYLAAAEVQVTGPRRFSEKLPVPGEYFRDVKVLAFRGHRKNLLDEARVTVAPTGSISPVADKPGSYQLSAGESSLSLSLRTEAVVRSILIYPGDYLNGTCTLQVKEGETYRTVKIFTLNRDASINLQKGFDQKAPIAEALPETKGGEFRLLFSAVKGESVISSIILTPSPVVQRYPGKVFAKEEKAGAMPALLTDRSLFVDPAEVLDISSCLSADGTLAWDVPEGEWTVLRTGMAPTGVMNSPTSPEATGWEADKMSKKIIRKLFESYLGQIYRRIPAADRRCWKYTVLDSYEKGGQNITDGMIDTFRKRYGYDPTPWLPAYYGYPVGDYRQTERFLWDMRRLVADEIASQYVGGLREISNKYGLRTWLENYGHGGFSAEFLQYGGQSDEVSGEFWHGRHVAEKRAAASCSHIYNKPRAWAESFTNDGRNGSAYAQYPGMLKVFLDQAFATGINSILYHVYIQQYANNDYPGVDGWFGTEFNRKNTWFSQLGLFTDYIKRSSFLLQQGRNVADVAYYIGENAPIMTGRMNPSLPKGCQFDFINSEVLLRDAKVADGNLVLSNGQSYRVLVLPSYSSMLPTVLKKLEQLVADGATIVGKAPQQSPSLENYPQCDTEVKDVAGRMWNKANRNGIFINYGKGRIVPDASLEETFDALGIMVDCMIDGDDKAGFIHRTLKNNDAEVYFITNQKDTVINITARFRVSGYKPERWGAMDGSISILPEYMDNGRTTSVAMSLQPYESTFVVFRKNLTPAAFKPFANVPLTTVLATVNGGWTITFQSDPIHRGPSSPVRVEVLADWTQSNDKRVKFYSGTAKYETTVQLEKQPVGRTLLDLGNVGIMARVKMNGHYAGGVWTAPYTVDVTGLVKKGSNKIEVEVVNTWLNRILGDRLLPQDERKLNPVTAPWKPGTPLQESGLIGPVRLLSVE